MNGGPSPRPPDAGLLRERYEQMRARALRGDGGPASDRVMRWGMRSWLEARWQEASAVAAPAPAEGRRRPDQDWQPIVAVWAGVLVGQAERSLR